MFISFASRGGPWNDADTDQRKKSVQDKKIIIG